MPNLAMATETICRAFNEAWRDRTPVDWPNVTRTGSRLADGDKPWSALDIFWDGGGNAAIGNRVFQRSGNLTVRIFVPIGQRGLEEAGQLAMAAASAFEGKTIDGVSFNNVGPRTVGPDGVWYQVNVRADFEFDEVKQ